MEIQKTISWKIGWIMSRDLVNQVRKCLEGLFPKTLFAYLLWVYITFIYLGKEQWIGLDNIYALTNRLSQPMQLRVHMEKFTGETAQVTYDNFYLEDQVWCLFRCNLFYITHLIHMSYCPF